MDNPFTDLVSDFVSDLLDEMSLEELRKYAEVGLLFGLAVGFESLYCDISQGLMHDQEAQVMQFLVLGLCNLLALSLLVLLISRRPDSVSIIDYMAIGMSVFLLPICFALGILQIFGVVPEIALFGGA